MILVEDLTIVSQREIAPRIFEMVLKGEMVADMKVGQFVHLKVPDPSKLLRRPISISEIDYDKKEATIVYRVEREGTAILSKMVAGQTIDTMGPQGNGFDIAMNRKTKYTDFVEFEKQLFSNPDEKLQEFLQAKSISIEKYKDNLYLKFINKNIGGKYEFKK